MLMVALGFLRLNAEKIAAGSGDREAHLGADAAARLEVEIEFALRYGAIFKVSGIEINGNTVTGAPGSGKARLITTVAMEGGTLAGSEQNIIRFYGEMQN